MPDPKELNLHLKPTKYMRCVNTIVFSYFYGVKTKYYNWCNVNPRQVTTWKHSGKILNIFQK